MANTQKPNALRPGEATASFTAEEIDVLDRLLAAAQGGAPPAETRALLSGKPFCSLLTKILAMKRRLLLLAAGRPS